MCRSRRELSNEFTCKNRRRYSRERAPRSLGGKFNSIFNRVLRRDRDHLRADLRGGEAPAPEAQRLPGPAPADLHQPAGLLFLFQNTFYRTCIKITTHSNCFLKMYIVDLVLRVRNVSTVSVQLFWRAANTAEDMNPKG